MFKIWAAIALTAFTMSTTLLLGASLVTLNSAGAFWYGIFTIVGGVALKILTK